MPRLPAYHLAATVRGRQIVWGVFDNDSHLVYYDRNRQHAFAWMERQEGHGKCTIPNWARQPGVYIRRASERPVP